MRSCRDRGPGMATFEGTIREFHSYLGPRIRNAINLFARKERMARNGICEGCHRSGQTLESAHVHGKGRRTIIEAVLAAYTVGGQVRCDFAAVEKEILDGHGPIAEAFRFLCSACHRHYDAALDEVAVPVNGREPIAVHGSGVELHFDPAPESVFKAELIKAKRAYVRLYLADGRVQTKIWNAAKFTADSDLRNNLGSGYLRNARARRITRAVFSITQPSAYIR
jgi:hypothetical protein